ncbi:phage antirepressor protein [Cryptobacterium sp. CAG:338]|jgi:anti-repressor protein|nr:phage antirepressor protein [Cryptobacterium sp. CAG:338]
MDIQVFNNEQFGNVRAMSLNDEPWFVAKDVCDVLGIKTNHLREDGRGLDDDEVMNLPNWEVGGKAPLIVSEAGFYKLVMRSRKPEAKAFQRWVTHEVLPAIRRTGGYMVAKQDETPEQIMARAVLVAQDTIERQKKQIEELKPKALFADAVAASDGTCLVGELAKMLKQNGVNMGQNRLFAWMREHGYLGKTGSNRNVPTQRAMEQGLFRIKETAVTHSDGHVTINRTPKVTGKGQRYFIDAFAKRGELVG